MTCVVILQPSYLPWLGYFEQIYRSDVFVFYDDVQFDKHGWRNRNRIKTATGWLWMTVPVLTEGYFGKNVHEIQIDNNLPWARKHLKAIETNYRKAPYYQDYIDSFRDIYSKRWQYIAELDIEFVKLICGLLGINRKFVRSKDLKVKGERSERLLEICRLFDARIYYSGESAKDYLNAKLFADAGIEVKYQHYDHPVYSQLYGEFIPFLSIVDLLFNCGSESLGILRGNEN